MKIKENIIINDSGFVLDSNLGTSFSLNYTGIEILKMLKEGEKEKDILEKIVQQFEMKSMDTLKKDFDEFIFLLKQNKILV